MKKMGFYFNPDRFTDKCDVLFFIFLTLKLAELGTVADWSWWWVFSPLWAGYIIATVLGSLFAPPESQLRNNRRAGIP